MAMTYLSDQDYHIKRDTLIDNKNTFDEVFTNTKKYLVSKKNRYYLGEKEDKLSPKELGLINKVKRRIVEAYETNGIVRMQVVNTPPAVYNTYNDYLLTNQPQQITDIIEVDLSGAYLTAALNIGLINPYMYELFFCPEGDPKKSKRKWDMYYLWKKTGGKKGRKDYIGTCPKTGNKIPLTYSKKCRLIALGQLASRKDIEHYVDGEMVEMERVENKEHANIFFYCSYVVGQTMLECMRRFKEGVYWFWTDALFIKKAYTKKVQDFLLSRDFPSKIVGVEYGYWHGNLKRSYVIKTGNMCKDTGEGIPSPYGFAWGGGLSTKLFENGNGLKENLQDVLDRYVHLKKLFVIDPKAVNRSIQRTTGIKGASLESVTFGILCDELNINEVSDINLNVLIAYLNSYGLNYKEFLKIKSLVREYTTCSWSGDVYGLATKVYIETWQASKRAGVKVYETEVPNPLGIDTPDTKTTILESRTIHNIFK